MSKRDNRLYIDDILESIDAATLELSELKDIIKKMKEEDNEYKN